MVTMDELFDGSDAHLLPNMAEMCAAKDEQYQSPCRHGKIVAQHACYCHCDDARAPRKCPIWRHYGESDLSKWHDKGDFYLDEWHGGCKWFDKTPWLSSE